MRAAMRRELSEMVRCGTVRMIAILMALGVVTGQLRVLTQLVHSNGPAHQIEGCRAARRPIAEASLRACMSSWARSASDSPRPPECSKTWLAQKLTRARERFFCKTLMRLSFHCCDFPDVVKCALAHRNFTAG